MMEKILKCINIYHIPWKVQIIYISHRKYENKVLILSNLHCDQNVLLLAFDGIFIPTLEKGQMVLYMRAQVVSQSPEFL